MKRTTDELLRELKGEAGAARLLGKIESVLADHYVVRPRGSSQTVQVRPATHTAIPPTTAQRAALVGRRCVLQQADEIAYMADILPPESGSAAYRGSTEPGQVVIKAVTPTPSGFWVEWYSLAFVDHYQVWTNDTAGGLSPLMLGCTEGTTWLISYEESQGYVAVRAVGVDGEPGETSQWVMCDDAPGMPLVFTSELRRDGHHFSWNNQTYTDRVRIFRDDDGEGEPTNKVWEGYSEEATIPYDATGGDTFFCATAVGYAHSESLPTAWIESDPTPPVPVGFSAASGVGQVVLVVDFKQDSAHLYPSFKEFRAWRADDSLGTNAEEIGRFSDSTWTYEMTMGTEAFFAVSANSWAEGKESERTDWAQGQSLRENAMEDDFSLYGGPDVVQEASSALWWLRVGGFEADEGWGSADGTSTVIYIEGTQTLYEVRLAGTDWIVLDLAAAWDLSADGRFTDDDYVYLSVYLSPDASDTNWLTVEFFTQGIVGSPYYYYRWSSGLVTGWNYLFAKKSDFIEHESVGESPDWSKVIQIKVGVDVGATTETTAYFDDLRIVKADPDDFTVGNDTGTAWDFSGGEWHVYGPDEEGVGAPYSLGQIKDAGGATEYIGAYTLKEFNSAGDGFRYVGRVRAFKDDGKVGLAWAIQDLTEGAEDLYVVYLDTTADKIYLQKAVDGSYSSLATEVNFVSAADTWYWVGIVHKGNEISVYVADHPNAIEGVNLKFHVTDTTYTQGKVGVWTQDSKARFTDLMAGSPEFAYRTYLSLIMAEGGGYGRQDYVPATNVQGRRTWVSDADPAASRQVQDGDIWYEPDLNVRKRRASGAWVEDHVGVEVYNSAAIPVGTGDWQALTFDSERRDDVGFHSTVADTSRLTVPTGYDGYYIITGHAAFATSGAGTRRLLVIRLGGDTFLATQASAFSAGGYSLGSVSAAYYLSASQYVELCAWQDSGGDLNVVAEGNYTPEFRMVRVR